MRLVENKTTTNWKEKKEQLQLIKNIVNVAYSNIREQIKDKLKNNKDNRFFIIVNMYLDDNLYKQKKIGFYGMCSGDPIYTGSTEIDSDMIKDFKEFYNNLFFYMEGFNETLRT